MTIASKGWRRTARLLDGEGPLAGVALLAMGAILVVNHLGRPAAADTSRLQNTPGCPACGTVVGVWHSAHSNPITFVEVRMRDGTLRTLRGPVDRFSVGDVVEVKGDALTARDVF